MPRFRKRVPGAAGPAATVDQLIGHNKVINSPNAKLGFFGADLQLPNIWRWFRRHTAKTESIAKPYGFQDTLLQSIIGREAFHRCIDGRSGTLLLHGKPGSGKSTIARGIISQIRNTTAMTGDVDLAYMFFNYAKSDEHKSSKVFMSFLQQLVGEDHPQFHLVRKLYLNHGYHDDSIPSAEDITNVLISVLSGSRSCIILDGVDEVEEPDELDTMYEQLARLQSNSGSGIILTSRSKIAITWFSAMEKVEIEADSDDVEAFTERYFASRRTGVVRTIPQQKDLRTKVIHAVKSASEGIFLLARINVAYLSTAESDAELGRMLTEMEHGLARPKASDELDLHLERVLHGRDVDTNRQVVRDIFACVLFARRPLTVSELMSAVAIVSHDQDLGKDSLRGAEDLFWLTCGLIERDEDEPHTVHFIAQSLEWYIMKSEKWRLELDRAAWRLAKSCVLYLSMTCFKSGFERRRQLLEVRRHHYPFLDYAARYWLVHYKKLLLLKNSHPSAEIRALLQDEYQIIRQRAYVFLQQQGNASSAWQVAMFADGVLQSYLHSKFPNEPDTMLTPLHIMHNERLHSEEDGLVYNDYNITGLHMACLTGDPALLEKLWNHFEGDRRAITTRGETHLHLAAASGEKDSAQFLISKGVDLNAVDSLGYTPICLAMSHGRSNFVQWLLQQDTGHLQPMKPIRPPQVPSPGSTSRSKTDKSSRGKERPLSGYTLLHQAVVGGYTPIVHALIQRREKLDISDSLGMTACHKAAKYGRLEILRSLVHHGQLNLLTHLSTEDRNPLHLAYKYGQTEVITYLLTLFPALAGQKDKNGHIPGRLAALRNLQKAQLLLPDDRASLLSFGRIQSRSSDTVETVLHRHYSDDKVRPLKRAWTQSESTLARSGSTDVIDDLQQSGKDEFEEQLMNYMIQYRDPEPEIGTDTTVSPDERFPSSQESLDLSTLTEKLESSVTR